jgi:ribosomal protein S18 acetylase RimI-like enzyme
VSAPARRLFPGTALAARIERADCRLLTDGAAAARRRHAEVDVYVRELAGGVATWTGEGSPLNKVAGLGFAGPLDPADLDEVERAFARRGAPVQVELSCLADPEVGRLLTRRGYALEGFENVLGLPLDPGLTRPQPPAGLVIARSGPEELAEWLEVVVTGFATPDLQGVPSHESFPREALERSMGDLAAADGFLRYLARRDGELAGGASLRQFEGVAQLCGAATLPAHRRRGVQSALLATRLAEAGEAGCDVAVVTTQPGSKSQENVQRQGFDLLYTRAILVR